MPKVLGIVHNSYKSRTATVIKNGIVTFKRDFSIQYAVLSDNTDQESFDIESADGIPPLLSPVSGSICRGYNSEEITVVPKHPTTGIPCTLWHVEAFFDNEINPEDQNNNPETPPESRRPKVKWGYETEEEVMEKDPISGDPIVTFPGEPIIITQPAIIATLTIKRFEPYPFNPNKIYDYGNHTNEQPFWGAPSNSAYMMPMTTEETVQSWGTGGNVQTALFDEVTYTIKFKMRKVEGGVEFVENTWMHQPLHQGYYYIPDDVDATDMSLSERKLASKLYIDPESGTPKIVNLSGNGKIIKTGEPEYLFFFRCPRADFNVLNLGPFG